MNEIQKYFYDRMIAELYAAQAELMANIYSKDSHSYFNGAVKDNLSSEIFNSLKELEGFLNSSVSHLQSNVTVQIKYNSLHARERNGFSLFNSKPTKDQQ